MLRVRWEGEFLEVVFSARAAFSKRGWPYFVAMVIPWLVLQGQRCVKSELEQQEKQYQNERKKRRKK